MHDHGNTNQRLWTVFSLSILYLFAELVGGWWTGSLALVADAGHMAIDTAAIALTLFARWIAHRPRSSRNTFGYHRAEILAALLNGAFLIAISFWIIYEAWHRFSNPVEVKGLGLTLIATGGLVVNLIGLKLLHSHSHDNLNLKGVWLHLMADALGSVSAMLAGVLVWQYGWYWADPVISVLLSLLVFYGAWKLVSDSTHVLLEGVPVGIDLEAVRSAMVRARGVKEICDLHIWTVTNGLPALSAHVVVENLAQGTEILNELNQILHEEFQIAHSTLQLELADQKHAGTHSDHCGFGHHH